MDQIVSVKLWGTTIGHLGYKPGQTEIATFEYTNTFAKSDIQFSPLRMKLPTAIHSFADISQRTFKGLPGIFADSLPDKFGNQLIDLFMAEKNIAPENITSLDRLLYIGSRGMGALEYHPEMLKEKEENNLALDVHSLAELASLVISKNKSKQDELLKTRTRSKAIRLIRVGSSAGGARSKALISKSPDGQIYDGTIDHGTDHGTAHHGTNHSYWLLKFDSEENQDRDNKDPKGMTRVEYVYSILAKECGIDIPRTDFIEDGGDFHFMIERFDRTKIKGRLEKLHYASWCGVDHAQRDSTGAYSYEQLAMVLRKLDLGQSALTELFKRAVFNVVGRNHDDHTKQFGFLMDKSGKWTFAPAFDLTYSYDPNGKWTKGHQIRLANKQSEFTRNDIIKFAKYCNINDKKSNKIIDKTTSVFQSFSLYADKFNIDSELKKTVCNNHLRL